MRELTTEEEMSVNGGFNPVPIISGMYLAWQIGFTTGSTVNSVSKELFGTTTGEAIYYLTN